MPSEGLELSETSGKKSRLDAKYRPLLWGRAEKLQLLRNSLEEHQMNLYLARNPIDGGSVIWAIKQNGIEIITPSQTFNQQNENSILMYLEFGMAQKFVDDLSKNVKRGLKTKAEKGWLPNGAKAGYMNDKTADKGNKRLFPDPIDFL